MRTEAEANRALSLYADTVRRVCLLHLRNHADVEDVFQDVFLKYVLFEQPFQNTEHEKAWLLRVAINRCNDVSRGFFRRRVASLDSVVYEPFGFDEQESEVLGAVLKLPAKYKDVIYLHYYEGYSAIEIAQIMNKNENTIYTWLKRARAQLKDVLGGEMFG